MSDAASTMVRMGRKRRPPPKANRTLRQRFARRLHELAGDRSNKEIAKACGVSTAAVARWFGGLDTPAIDYWPDLAKALGLKDYRDLLPPK